MRVRRIETVIQFVADPEASKRWYADLLGVEPTPYEGPYFRFEGEHAYLILAPGAGHWPRWHQLLVRGREGGR